MPSIGLCLGKWTVYVILTMILIQIELCESLADEKENRAV